MQFEPKDREHLRQCLGFSFDHQDVAGTHPSTQVGRDDPNVPLNDPEDLGIHLGKLPLKFAEPHPFGLAPCRDAYLGDVGTGFKALHSGLSAGWHQTPSEERYKQDSGRGHGKADGGEVEHRKPAQPGFGPEPRHDDVGRGANECRHPPENRPEGERHQDLAGRDLEPSGHMDSHRHEQGHRPHVVHEG